MTTLVLLRHAKSAYPEGVPDHERPLNARGRRDAPVAGRLIGQAVPQIDLALVSTATRAQQTYALAAPGITVAARRDEPGLYLASPDAMLGRIRAEQADSVLVVAHNPGTEDLAAMLAGEVTWPKFPTAAFAVLRAEAPLSEWREGCASLDLFAVGRG